MGMLLARSMIFNTPDASGSPGFHEMSGIASIAWFMAGALIVFSILYLVAGAGLSRQKPWARYTAGSTFVVKVVLCVWLGHASVGSLLVFS